ncbi:MAG: hypothetical protein ACLU5C_10560 [Acutalibacter sp.]
MRKYRGAYVLGSDCGSAKSAPLNKEKKFSSGDFERRLHGMANLTGSIFEKQAGVFFLLLDFLHGIAEREDNPPDKRQPAGQNQTRPCVALCAVLGAE